MNPPDLPPPLPNPIAPVVSAGQPPRPSPLSLKLLGRINVSLLLAGLNTWMLSFADPDEGTLLSGFIIFLVAATLGVVLLLHRFWQKVDDGTLRYSPAIYAWLNLVPVLNLYWQFVSFVGLSKAVNRQLEARGLAHLKVSVGMAVARGVVGVIGFALPLCLADELSPLVFLASASLVSPLTVILDFFLFRGYIKAFESLEGPAA
jgi:hypothetical protein